MDIFALVVLIILLVVGLALWGAIGYLPGKIARERGHPQADAISVCGWLGALTFGILAPLAFIWAYTNPNATLSGAPKPSAAPTQGGEAS